jgi:hypothetical protein
MPFNCIVKVYIFEIVVEYKLSIFSLQQCLILHTNKY